MRLNSVFFLVVAATATVIQPRSPQDAHAPGNTPKPKGLGPFGIDLSFLQGFDGARLGPFLARMQPYFRPVAKSGAIPNVLRAFVPTLSLSNKVVLEPQIRASAQRAKSRLGPLVLAGKGKPKPAFLSPGSFLSLDPNGQSFINLFDAKSLCTNCTVLSTRIGLEFEDGTPADPEKGVYAHHILAIDLSRPGVITSLPCDFDTVNKTIPFDPMLPVAFFAVQGEDNGDLTTYYTPKDGKFDSGFHIGANDKFLINLDLVNYNVDNKQVFVTMDIEYMEGKHGLDSQPNLLNVVGCKLNEPKISTEGPAETASRKFPILVDGSILWIRGHMHNGGERMVLYMNDQIICNSEAKYDAKNNLQAMDTCDKVIKVKKGDELTIKSIYDITKHPMRANAHGEGSSQDIVGGHDLMGMFAISIAIDDEKKE